MRDKFCSSAGKPTNLSKFYCFLRLHKVETTILRSLIVSALVVCARPPLSYDCPVPCPILKAVESGYQLASYNKICRNSVTGDGGGYKHDPEGGDNEGRLSKRARRQAETMGNVVGAVISKMGNKQEKGRVEIEANIKVKQAEENALQAQANATRANALKGFCESDAPSEQQKAVATREWMKALGIPDPDLA